MIVSTKLATYCMVLVISDIVLMMFFIVFGTNQDKVHQIDTPSINNCCTLRILHVNIRSLKPHLDKLEALIMSLESPPEIMSSRNMAL